MVRHGREDCARTVEGPSNALFYRRIEAIEILDRVVGIDQPVGHRPNTAAWDFTRPALKSRRASRMLCRYSGEVASSKSSRKARRAVLFIPFTARIMVSGLTSIFSAVGVLHPPSET